MIHIIKFIGETETKKEIYNFFLSKELKESDCNFSILSEINNINIKIQTK